MLSVLLMCLGSLMIAVTPTYASIGRAAPVLLGLARVIQGLSLGGEYGASATYLSEVAEQPSADGTHDETERKQDSCIQLLHHRIVAWKERAGEIERKRRIGVKIVPFDKVAGRTDEDRLHPAAHVSELKLFAAPDGRWQGHCKLFYHNDMVGRDLSSAVRKRIIQRQIHCQMEPAGPPASDNT